MISPAPAAGTKFSRVCLQASCLNSVIAPDKYDSKRPQVTEHNFNLAADAHTAAIPHQALAPEGDLEIIRPTCGLSAATAAATAAAADEEDHLTTRDTTDPDVMVECLDCCSCDSGELSGESLGARAALVGGREAGGGCDSSESLRLQFPSVGADTVRHSPASCSSLSETRSMVEDWQPDYSDYAEEVTNAHAWILQAQPHTDVAQLLCNTSAAVAVPQDLDIGVGHRCCDTPPLHQQAPPTHLRVAPKGRKMERLLSEWPFPLIAQHWALCQGQCDQMLCMLDSLQQLRPSLAAVLRQALSTLGDAAGRRTTQLTDLRRLFGSGHGEGAKGESGGGLAAAGCGSVELDHRDLWNLESTWAFQQVGLSMSKSAASPCPCLISSRLLVSLFWEVRVCGTSSWVYRRVVLCMRTRLWLCGSSPTLIH